MQATEPVIPSPGRGARIAAYVAFAATTAVWILDVAFGWLSRDVAANSSWGLGGLSAGMLFSLSILTFPICGILIAARQPRNRIAWLLLLIGASWSLGALTTYSDYGLRLHPGSVPGAAVVAAIGAAFWVPAVGVTGSILLLVFPNGHRLPGRRWRAVAAAAWTAMAVALASQILSPGTMGDAGYPHTQNPLGIGALRPLAWVGFVALAALLATMVAGAASVVVRFRRSTGTERLQITWLAAAGAAVVAVYAIVAPLSVAFDPGAGRTPGWLSALQVLALVSFALVPAAIGTAVLRHRLYDIDLIIRRTLVYTALVAVLGAAYLGGVAGLGAAFRSLTGQSGTLAVTLSTLAVAAAFQPARARIQNAVDRRFARDRYDAERALAGLAQRLREGVELDGIRDDVLAVVETTVRPRHAHVWLRPGEEAR